MRGEKLDHEIRWNVILVGKCAEPGPKLTCKQASKPEAKLTVIVSEGKGEQTFNLYVPIFIYGAGAERAAEEVDAGVSSPSMAASAGRRR